MYDHPFLKENVEKCKSAGIKFMGPKIEEGKAKIADIEEIVENVIYNVGKKNLRGKKILVIGGSTIEPIDDVRIVTNRSSGKTATALVKNAFERGAETEFWYGNGTEKNPPYIPIKRFESVKDLINLIEKTDLKKFDIIVNCAAISDYTPERKKRENSFGERGNRDKIEASPEDPSEIAGSYALCGFGWI
jgi:Phosphopantothenoylcysteine synthetase/decarboxylase